MVGQARRMFEEYGFGSMKLKAGVFDPDLRDRDAARPAPRLPRRTFAHRSQWRLVGGNHPARHAAAARRRAAGISRGSHEDAGGDGRGREVLPHPARHQHGHHRLRPYPRERAPQRGPGDPVRPPLLGRPARHPEPRHDRAHLRHRHLHALELAYGHQPRGDDACGGDDPEPQPTPPIRTIPGRRTR